MIILELVGPGWIREQDDDPSDQCAHGRVHLAVDEMTFIRPDDGEWAVSAAGLFLLRTLEEDHTLEDSVAEHNLLFPCCGHSVFEAASSRYGLVCIGCPGGCHIDVLHREGSVVLRGQAGEAVVDETEWRSAVLRFCDQVQAFYDGASPKEELDGEDGKGWKMFWAEWRTRRTP
jgi:hypothetical protein